MAEQTIGFSIQIKGTDSEIGRLQEMKKELAQLQEKFASYSNKSSVHAIALQTQIKALTGDINKQQKSIIDNSRQAQHAAGSYNYLTAQNKKLSEALRSLPIGSTNAHFNALQKQLLQNTDKLKEFDAQIGRHHRNVGDYGEGLNKLRGNLASVASTFGIAIGAAAVFEFVNDVVKVAAAAEGIKKAFDKLNDPKLLDQLRTATKGTVSDLELMKGAVKANNFQIPLEQLGTLFKFAQQRAQETGESVEYLTESIVLGISRKSIPILDNLGISSQQVQKEFKKTGDFAKAVTNIVEQGLAKQGDLALTTADKTARLTAVWDNFKVKAGEFVINEGNRLLEYFNLLNGSMSLSEKQIQNVSAELLVVQNSFNNELLKRARNSDNERLKAIEITEKEVVRLAKAGKEEQDFVRKSSYLNLLKNEQKFLDDLKNLNKKSVVEETEDEKKEREKREAEAKKANEERLKENLRLARLIQDQQAELIRDEEVREKAKEGLRHTRAIEDIENSVADEEQKSKALLSEKQTFEKNYEDITKKYADKSLIENKKLADAEIKAEQDLNAELDRIFQENLTNTLNKTLEANKLQADQRRKNNEDIRNGAIQLGSELSDLLYQNERDQNARLLEQSLSDAENRRNTELTALEERLRTGNITEAQFKIEKAAQDKQFEKEAYDLKKKAFEDEKRLKSQQIGIELVIELARIASAAAANPTNGVTFGAAGIAQYAIQAGIAIGRSGIQLAAVQNAQFAKGGLLQGDSHERGGIPFTINGRGGFEAEGGEAIINKRSVAMFRNELSAINQAGGGRSFALGGVMPPLPRTNSSGMQSVQDLERFAQSIVNGINDKKVYQVESDYRRVSNRVRQIESDSSF